MAFEAEPSVDFARTIAAAGVVAILDIDGTALTGNFDAARGIGIVGKQTQRPITIRRMAEGTRNHVISSFRNAKLSRISVVRALRADHVLRM